MGTSRTGVSYASENPDLALRAQWAAKKRAERAKNPEHVKARQRKYYTNRAEWVTLLSCLRRYNLTLDEYHSIYERQDFVCAICHREDCSSSKSLNGRLFVDHCHVTGKVRGLLCHGCNIVIGNVGDSIVLLDSAIQYLRKSS